MPSAEDTAEIPPEKINSYRAVCNLERQGATEGERLAAKKARERLEVRYPGIAEAAGAAADAERGPATGRPHGPVDRFDWREFLQFMVRTAGSTKKWLDDLASDAELEADITEIMESVEATAKATKKTIAWRFVMDAEDFGELADVCGEDMDSEAWKSAAKKFGAIAEEVFLNTFSEDGDEK